MYQSRIKPSLDARELWWQCELDRMNDRTAKLLFKDSERSLWIALILCGIIDLFVR